LPKTLARSIADRRATAPTAQQKKKKKDPTKQQIPTSSTPTPRSLSKKKKNATHSTQQPFLFYLITEKKKNTIHRNCIPGRMKQLCAHKCMSQIMLWTAHMCFLHLALNILLGALF
jgi:hypothetical protein